MPPSTQGSYVPDGGKVRENREDKQRQFTVRKTFEHEKGRIIQSENSDTIRIQLADIDELIRQTKVNTSSRQPASEKYTKSCEDHEKSARKLAEDKANLDAIDKRAVDLQAALREKKTKLGRSLDEYTREGQHSEAGGGDQTGEPDTKKQKTTAAGSLGRQLHLEEAKLVRSLDENTGDGQHNEAGAGDQAEDPATKKHKATSAGSQGKRIQDDEYLKSIPADTTGYTMYPVLQHFVNCGYVPNPETLRDMAPIFAFGFTWGQLVSGDFWKILS